MTAPPPDPDDDNNPALFARRLSFLEKDALPRHHQKLGGLEQRMVELVGIRGDGGHVKKLNGEIARLDRKIDAHESDRDAVDYREAERLDALIRADDAKHAAAEKGLASRIGKLEDARDGIPWTFYLAAVLTGAVFWVLELLTRPR